jgi:hypothetical protein
MSLPRTTEPVYEAGTTDARLVLARADLAVEVRIGNRFATTVAPLSLDAATQLRDALNDALIRAALLPEHDEGGEG